MEHITVNQFLRTPSGNAAILLDDNLIILDISDSLLAIDVKKKACIGNNLFSLLKPAYEFFPSISEALDKKLFSQFMSTIPTKVGNRFFLWMVYSYEVKHHGQHHLLTGLDISDIASTLNEMFFISSNIVNNIPYFLCWKDTRSKFLGCNKNFLNLVGLTNYKDIVGKTDFDLPWTREQATKYRKDDHDVIFSGYQKTFYIERQSQYGGQERIVQVSKIPFKINDKLKGVVCIYRNLGAVPK